MTCSTSLRMRVERSMPAGKSREPGTMKSLVSLLSIVLLGYGISAPAAGSTIVHASEAGARLDSHLLKGGGTDDTRVLQGILDQAKQGKALHLILDGPALVSGLNV